MRRSGWRGRIALGLTALVAPTLAGGLMIGKDGSRGGAKLLSRMVGARDVALGLGTVIALDRGAPVRGWLEASALADGADAAASWPGSTCRAAPARASPPWHPPRPRWACGSPASSIRRQVRTPGTLKRWLPVTRPSGWRSGLSVRAAADRRSARRDRAQSLAPAGP